MPRLEVNVDHIATLRQARLIDEPDPVTAAALAELAGADGIIVHLREDRRHIQDRDLRLLRQTIKTRLNLEMAATQEMLEISTEVKPNLVTLVPEKRQELTTEGGLEVAGNRAFLKDYVRQLQEGGLRVSLFVDPVTAQIEAAKEVGAEWVELHTGAYADAPEPARGHPALPGIAQRRPARPQPRPQGEVRPRPQLPQHQALPGPGGVRRVLHRPRHHGPGHPGGNRAGRPGDDRADQGVMLPGGAGVSPAQRCRVRTAHHYSTTGSTGVSPVY